MDLVTELRKIVSAEGRVTVEREQIDRHGRGWKYHTPHPPDAVVFPSKRDEIVEIIRFANEWDVPVVPYGEGSSLEGHTIPLHGGISLDLSQMHGIREIRPKDFIVSVEPGVTHGQLNEQLKEYELFFPVDPGWNASLGGMAGTNASGTNAVRYGTMRTQVLDLEVVLADGRIMRTGGKAVKSSAGYNLTGLFVGSEGTLGVFTELTLRVYPIPERILAGRAVFSDIVTAGRAAIAMLQSGLQIGRVEMVDPRTIESVNSYKSTDYAIAPTLFLEFSGSQISVDHDVETASRILKSHGCETFEFESGESGREKLWEARHEAGLAIKALNPDKSSMTTDVCVPISDLPDALNHARNTMDAHGIDGAILGHIGDGNYHAVLPVDPEDETEFSVAEQVNAEIVAYALERGGTCSGEHGIGSGKIEHLQKEHGDSLPFMQEIKLLADPKGIMNPGKIFSSS